MRSGFERRRRVELLQRRRAQRGLKFGIERRALNGRRPLRGLCAPDQCVGVRGILDSRRALGRICGVWRRRRRYDKAVALKRAIDLREIGGMIRIKIPAMRATIAGTCAAVMVIEFSG